MPIVPTSEEHDFDHDLTEASNRRSRSRLATQVQKSTRRGARFPMLPASNPIPNVLSRTTFQIAFQFTFFNSVFSTPRSKTIRMNRNLTLLTALAAGLVSAPFAIAQAAPAEPAGAHVAPVAVDAKIALVNFEQVVLASNEGQTVTLATQKKYEPKRADLEKLAAEVDSMKKSLQAAPTTLPDDERASRLRAIDTKEKQLNRDAEDAQTAYNTEWQEALGKVASKIATTMKNYAQTNGYTILLDVSAQNSNVLWALPSTDISQAVVDAYNKQSGIAAPPPPAPRAAAKPSTGTSTAPKK